MPIHRESWHNSGNGEQRPLDDPSEQVSLPPTAPSSQPPPPKPPARCHQCIRAITHAHPLCLCLALSLSLTPAHSRNALAHHLLLVLVRGHRRHRPQDQRVRRHRAVHAHDSSERRHVIAPVGCPQPLSRSRRCRGAPQLGGRRWRCRRLATALHLIIAVCARWRPSWARWRGRHGGGGATPSRCLRRWGAVSSRTLLRRLCGLLPLRLRGHHSLRCVPGDVAAAGWRTIGSRQTRGPRTSSTAHELGKKG